MQLTDEDRAAIDRIYKEVHVDDPEILLARHFIRVGMERAAQICDEEAALPPVGSTSYHVMWIGGARKCATDIRAAAEK